MAKFNPSIRYILHANALEESLMSLTHGDTDSWEDMLTDCLSYWSNDDAQKVLSELNLDTTEAGAVNRLWTHYADPENRDATISSWHWLGHYLPHEDN